MASHSVMAPLAWFGFFLAAAGLAVAAQRGSAPGAVQVIREEPEVSYHTYEAANPPPKLAALTKTELGVCLTEFGCSAAIRSTWPAPGQRPGSVTLTAVSITARVRIEIWTQKGSGDAVLEHENTHRRISEHYYAAAEDIGRRLASALIGRKIVARGPDDRAAAVAMDGIKQQLLDDFMRETSRRCQYAQERFDAITDHGRNSLPNATAMAQAIAAENVHWVGQTVRPTRPRT